MFPFVRLSLYCLLLVIPGMSAALAAQEGDLLSEEAENYFRKWLDEDALYLVTDEERSVFSNLTTPEEKEQFIEQFWYRRDPDPSTVTNEFKEEHYRRIAYANEHFSSGLPGWLSDRGRIYIMHGPPAEIEPHPSGGFYERPLSEGGGSTSAFPFEVWRYRHIEGVGSDIELEFVDPSLTGEYRLALNPEEKDALLYVPGGGPTLAEELGLAEKADRPWFSPGNRGQYPLMHERARDNPFSRYETYSLVQRPAEIKYRDLREIVDVNIGYGSIPMQVEPAYFRLDQERVLVPITLQVRNRDLSFGRTGDIQSARLTVYGRITSIANRVVLEFEDEISTEYPADSFRSGLLQDSVYQKIVPLDPRFRYKLDLVIKDQNSKQVGAVRKALQPPTFVDGRLASSSVLMAEKVVSLERIPDQDEMFVLGDVKIRPELDRNFLPDSPVGVYFQLYGVKLDQASLEPALQVIYSLSRDGVTLSSVADEGLLSVQYFSAERVVLIKDLDVSGLGPGRYTLLIEVRDLLASESLEVAESFTIG